MLNVYLENTLVYDPALCNGCGVCAQVCPHAAFEMDGRLAVLVRPQVCMECGACQLNCITGAIHVVKYPAHVVDVEASVQRKYIAMARAARDAAVRGGVPVRVRLPDFVAPRARPATGSFVV